MKTNKIISLLLMVVVVMAFTACKKDPGAGGKKNLTGTVTYFDGAVAVGATVSIAYDATEATTEFNDVTLTGSDGTFSFEGLTKGDYYIDAEYVAEQIKDGQDYAFACDGATVLIDKKKGDLDVGTLVLE